MSQLICDQNFESDILPWVSGQLTFVRSATNKINGSYSLRGGNGTAADGYGYITLATADRRWNGSARGLRFQASFLLKIVTQPSGCDIVVLRGQSSIGGTQGILSVADGGTKLKGMDATLGATSLGATAHRIEIDYSESGKHPTINAVSAARQIVRLDGAVELDISAPSSGIGVSGYLSGFWAGVSIGGKGIWEAVWDDMRIWLASDPT